MVARKQRPTLQEHLEWGERLREAQRVIDDLVMMASRAFYVTSDSRRHAHSVQSRLRELRFDLEKEFLRDFPEYEDWRKVYARPDLRDG